jgi:hypothetical protein
LTADEIERLGVAAYRSTPIGPLSKVGRLVRAQIIGFDTEYDAATRELLTMQFSHEGHELYVECPEGWRPRWSDIDACIVQLLTAAGKPVNKRRTSHAILGVWWYLAEAQHILDLLDAEIIQHSTGFDFRQKVSGRVVEMIDVQKFWANPPLPLRVVAASFGRPKLDWQRAAVSRADLRKPGFREYAMNDAHIVEHILVTFRAHMLDAWGVDILRARTPALASSWVFRSLFLQQEIEPPDPRVRLLAMRSAWGGRNEAYIRGRRQGNIGEYDAFSQHPSSAVALGRLPDRPGHWYEIDRVERCRATGGFVDVRFEHPARCRFPALPVYADGKLLYPLAGRTQCSLSEARVAFRAGARLDVIEGYGYHQGTTDLTGYFKALMAERRNAKAAGDAAATHATKLLLNSLVGKLAQRTERRDLNVLLGLAEMAGLAPAMLATMDRDELNELAWDYNVEEPCGVALGSLWMPEWNSLIIGYARASISAALLYAERAGVDVLFSSTDAILVDGQLPPVFNLMKVRFEERHRSPAVEIMRTRFYRIADADGGWSKVAHHAAPFSVAAQVLEAFLSGDPAYTFQTRRFVTLRESVIGQGVLGDMSMRDIRMSTAWDNKRRLVRGGATVPWRSVAEYEESTGG